MVMVFASHTAQEINGFASLLWLLEILTYLPDTDA